MLKLSEVFTFCQNDKCCHVDDINNKLCFQIRIDILSFTLFNFEDAQGNIIFGFSKPRLHLRPFHLWVAKLLMESNNTSLTSWASSNTKSFQNGVNTSPTNKSEKIFFSDITSNLTFLLFLGIWTDFWKSDPKSTWRKNSNIFYRVHTNIIYFCEGENKFQLTVGQA